MTLTADFENEEETIEGPIEYQFKIVLIGQEKIGKTSLIQRFCFKQFYENLPINSGLSFNTTSIPIREENANYQIGLSLWDFGGQEQYKILLPQFILGANAALLVFDMTNLETLENLVEEWFPLLIENAPDIPTILVGTKMDLVTSEKEINYVTEITKRYQKELGSVAFLQTSAKFDLNIEKIFIELIHNMMKSPQFKKKNIDIML